MPNAERRSSRGRGRSHSSSTSSYMCRGWRKVEPSSRAPRSAPAPRANRDEAPLALLVHERRQHVGASTFKTLERELERRAGRVEVGRNRVWIEPHTRLAPGIVVIDQPSQEFEGTPAMCV